MNLLLKRIKLLLLLGTIVVGNGLSAQTDMTNLLTNPSFESGNLTGWTWTGTTGYAWLGPNTDGDATKDGSYICGIWNSSIGDAECAQSLTELANGYYKVTALATVSNERGTNQRLFATSAKGTTSQLFGDSSYAAYSASNLAVLGTNENYSFGGYSESANERGPFNKLSVVSHVTDGNLKLGIRVSGKSNTAGYDFSHTTKGDAGFFKFDNFTLTEVGAVATLDNITLSIGELDSIFNSSTETYNAVLPPGTSSVTPEAIPTIEGVVVTGTDPVDVTSGTGVSSITVTSLDGTASKSYTINYTVLTLSSDATLSALSVSVGTLFPAFSPSKTSYKVLVPVGTITVIPSATLNDSTATLSGLGEVTLIDGKGISTIEVTAENGNRKTYTINYDQDYIANPSFETGDFTGWTWIGATGYTWMGVNTDGDATKTGLYVAGIWNASFGDVELSQTLSGLTNGTYLITADLMGSSNSSSSRLTTQRLFANGVSMLFSEQSAYSEENLSILGETEAYSFGNYSETQSDSGPFKTLSVLTQVTDGTITLGIRTNGKSSSFGYTFPNLIASEGHGWFKVDNFTMTYYSSSITSSLEVEKLKCTYSVVDGKLNVKGSEGYTVFNIQGVKVASVTADAENTSLHLNAGIYIVKTNKNETFKVIVR